MLRLKFFKFVVGELGHGPPPVYIPLPTVLHAEWVAKSVIAGKHVLVEKPVARNAKELNAMLDECVEAMRGLPGTVTVSVALSPCRVIFVYCLFFCFLCSQTRPSHFTTHIFFCIFRHAHVLRGVLCPIAETMIQVSSFRLWHVRG